MVIAKTAVAARPPGTETTPAEPPAPVAPAIHPPPWIPRKESSAKREDRGQDYRPGKRGTDEQSLRLSVPAEL